MQKYIILFLTVLCGYIQASEIQPKRTWWGQYFFSFFQKPTKPTARELDYTQAYAPKSQQGYWSGFWRKVAGYDTPRQEAYERAYEPLMSDLIKPVEPGRDYFLSEAYLKEAQQEKNYATNARKRAEELAQKGLYDRKGLQRLLEEERDKESVVAQMIREEKVYATQKRKMALDNARKAFDELEKADDAATVAEFSQLLSPTSDPKKLEQRRVASQEYRNRSADWRLKREELERRDAALARMRYWNK